MLRLLSLAVAISVAVMGFLIYIFRNQQRAQRTQQLQRAEDELHPLLKEFTTFRSYTTPIASYPSIRTFYRPHPKKGDHDEIAQLPLLVFVHGLGGVLPQFAPVLGSLSHIAPCFGLELPGHGRSTFMPKVYAAYTIEANTALWKVAIEDVCYTHGHKEVVFVGHSMGCSLAALLISKASHVPALALPVLGMVAICPRAHKISPNELKGARTLFALPDIVIDLLRWLDRRGGPNSTSVKRVVGETNETDLKHLQYSWNRQFRTPVWKRLGVGLLPSKNADGNLIGGYPAEAVWKGISNPLFLIAGESDTVTRPEEVRVIVNAIFGSQKDFTHAYLERPARSQYESSGHLIPTSFEPIDHVNQVRCPTIHSIIFPAPAAHALLYAHSTYRMVSGLIESFLSHNVSRALSQAYQLQLLTVSGKWDVKNLEKWKKVAPVSLGIAQSPAHPYGLFRALKTMREQDDEHSPTAFLQRNASKIYAVIDISKDAPIYDVKALDRGGVEYHKFPTVSKIPPTPVEVQDFCNLVDKLLAEQDSKLQDKTRAISVHCHYGYNRTGFFIVSYLISRLGFGVEEAIEEFKRAKEPGIRHQHFLDTLWLRYAKAGARPLPEPLGTNERQEKYHYKKASLGKLTVPSFDNEEENAEPEDIDPGALTETDLL